MKTSLLRQLAISGVLLFAFATSAHAQNAYSGVQEGGPLTSGQSRTWSFDAPAGSYAVFGRVAYNLSSGIDGAGLICMLKLGNTDEFYDRVETSISQESYFAGEMTLAAQMTIPAPATVSIQCRGIDRVTGVQRVVDVSLELIQVNSIGTLRAIDTTGPAIQQDRVQQNQRGRGRNN
jgi:hypothetical protein